MGFDGASAFSRSLCWNIAKAGLDDETARKEWIGDTGITILQQKTEDGTCPTSSLDALLPNVKGLFDETWAQALLGAMGMVLIGLVVYMNYTPAVKSEAPTPATTMQPM